MDQVLTNLLSNALKYSPEGGKVCLRLEMEDGTAVIQVRAEGIGMTPEEQGRLFVPFTRMAEASHVASGTGLGLYITRQIVEAHGGTVTVESGMGQGSTFTVPSAR